LKFRHIHPVGSKGRIMAEALLLEFAGVTADQYRAVNKVIGLNPEAEDGPWPLEMHSHTAGVNDDGNLVVFEVWESRDSQAAWMASWFGPALVRVGLPEPKRVEWMSVVGLYAP